jgi:hypothetical protein
MDDMPPRVAALEEIARATAGALDRLDRRIDALAVRLDALAGRIDALDAEHRTDFRWLLGIMLGGALLAAMAHGFHWL